jgi:hypothetical protein
MTVYIPPQVNILEFLLALVFRFILVIITVEFSSKYGKIQFNLDEGSQSGFDPETLRLH